MIVKTHSIAALVVALALPLAMPATAQDASTVVARANGVEITLAHVLALREMLPPQLQAAPGDRLFPALVNQLIDQELIAQSMAAEALSPPDRARLENQTRAFLSGVALQAQVSRAVTDESIAVAYAAFVEAYGAAEPVPEWNAAHILVRTEEEARAAAEAIAGGRDFGDLAREVSTDGAARQGGDLGWFGPGMMIPEFEEAVRALEPGQVSEPIQTRFGWHLVRLADRRIASVPPLEQMRDQLIEELQREVVQSMIGNLRGTAQVEDLSSGIDPEVLRRTDLMGN